MTTITRTALVLAGLAGTFIVAPAFAQETGVLEEIIVTAERREADLQEVPIAVTALSMEQMEQWQIRQSQDLQRYVPSLNMFNNVTSPTNLSPSLRGGLQQDGVMVVAESPFGVYVDDIFIGRMNGNNLTMTDVERIEVLRGPQGTLYGRNTGYGAIKIVSRTPGEDMWFDATVGAGNYDQLRFEASVGGPLGSSWAGSLTGQYIEKEGQYSNIFEPTPGNPVGDTDSQENTAFRGKLRYMGGDIFDGVLTISYTKAENDSIQMPNFTTPNVPTSCRFTPPDPDPCPGNTVAQFTTEDTVITNGAFTVNTPTGPLFVVDGTFAPVTMPLIGDKTRGETEQTIVGLDLSWNFRNGMTLRSITGFVSLEDFMQTDFSGDYARPPANGLGLIAATQADSDQITQEFHLVGTAFNDRLNYLLGAFFLNEEADQPFNWILGVAPGAVVSAGASQSLIDAETDSFAVFGDATFAFTDNLSGTLGVRYTDDSKDFTYDFVGFAGPPFGPPIGVPQNCAGSLDPNRCVLSSDEDDWMPRAVLEYTFGESGVMIYGSYAEGFKGAGFSAIATFSTDPIGVVGPETNKTYEAGMKATWLDDRLRTNLAYFFSDIEDIQQNATDVTNPVVLEFPVENAGDAEIQGLEFELTAVPVDGLNLFLNGSLMDGEYTRLSPASSAAAARVVFGVEPQTPQTPDYMVNIGFDYTFDLPGDLFGDFAFGFDYYEIDDYITASTNDFFNSGWDQWNGFISMDIAENWQLQLTGKNLSDNVNHTSGSRALGGGVYLPPREFLFMVTYRMQ